MYCQSFLVISVRGIELEPTTDWSCSDGCIGFMKAAFGVRFAPLRFADFFAPPRLAPPFFAPPRFAPPFFAPPRFAPPFFAPLFFLAAMLGLLWMIGVWFRRENACPTRPNYTALRAAQ